MLGIRKWLILLLLAFAPAAAEAQERPPADTVPSDSSAMMGMQMAQMRQMMPMMTEMMRNVTQSSIAALTDPEIARNLARFTRNYYEALVAEGFSEEQALQIVANLGFPPPPGM